MSRKVFDHCNMRAVSVQWVEGRGVPDLYNKQDWLLSKELSLVLSWKSTVTTQGFCLHPLQIGCSGKLATLYQLNVVHDSWWAGLERQGLNRKMAGTEKKVSAVSSCLLGSGLYFLFLFLRY